MAPVAIMESSSSSTSDVDNGTERDRGRRRVFICSSSNRSKKRINKKEIFGVSMLIIVDLIWVGSAGLTRVMRIIIITYPSSPLFF